MTSGLNPPDPRPDLLSLSTSLLGWDNIRDALAHYACSPVTQSVCHTLTPEPSYESARNLLEKTKEMVLLLSTDEIFPLDSFEDSEPILKAAAENRILNPEQCQKVIQLLRVCRAVRRSLEKKTTLRHLNSFALRLEVPTALLKEMENCIDDDGEIRENATPELRAAIREVQAVKQKLDTRIAKLMSSTSYKDALQDNYTTEREERCVLPIRADSRSRIEGIVHDSSGSGQTLYMEPTEIIPLNNQIKISNLRVAREKVRILQDLATKVLEYRDALITNQEILCRLDLIHAKARLAKTMDARFCPLTLTGTLELKQARNPELVLSRQFVVANTITWDAKTRVIIISGPNTGGKTVTLKTIGLMSLMVRAGLFLPVEEGSEILFFPEVYADIGDDQNIQLNLSTFSAHLEKIIRMLEQAQPGSLILLDELGIATDPIEGAALAEAILIELKNKNMMTLVSTHYLSLKILAQTLEGFANACMQFEPESFAPTYRLLLGVPGQSAALETAERLGLPKNITTRARKIYHQKDHRAETLLNDLTEQRIALEQELESVKIQSLSAKNFMDEQKRIADALREEKTDYAAGKAKRLKTAVADARLQIQKMLQDIKNTKEPRKLRKVEEKIRSLAKPPQAEKDLSGWTVPHDRIKIGDRVLVKSLGASGILLDDPANKKKVRVKIGNLPTLVEIKRLLGHVSGGPKQKPLAEGSIKIQVHASPDSQAKQTCDLRGMISEEALIALEDFISQAIVNRIGRGIIIHGHGMGTIKSLARDYLESTGVCKSFTKGSRHEGGDGVTVVEFYNWDR